MSVLTRAAATARNSAQRLKVRAMSCPASRDWYALYRFSSHRRPLTVHPSNDGSGSGRQVQQASSPGAPGWVRDRLPPGDLGAPLGARFLVALADRIGAHVGTLDALLAADRRRGAAERRAG